jgi:hypothetical protein
MEIGGICRKRPIDTGYVKLPASVKTGADIELFGRIGVWLGTTAKWQITSDKGIEIETLEGTMKASPGDYILRGVRGEMWPVKPEIFEETYDVLREPFA